MRNENERMTTEIALSDLARVGPLAPAGRFLRRFWQPIYVSADLQAGRAVPLRILAEDFTLYRGESGEPHLVAFRCAHRGTQLSTGWVEEDTIRCFYHGWVYGPDGQCVEQPAEPEPFCNRIRVKSYPVEEYVGLIFAFLGDGAAPEFPRYPQIEGEGVLETHAYERECSYFNSIENNMDEVHIAFVHRSSTFSETGLNQFLPEISGEETPYGMIRRGSRPNGATRILHLVMPNLLVFKGAPTMDTGETEGRDQFAWRVPIDDYTHRSFNVSFVHATGEAAQRYRERMARRQGPLSPSANELAWSVLRGEQHVDELNDRPDIVNLQDIVAQVGQGQIPDREQDHLGHSDMLLVLLRSIFLRELQALLDGRQLTLWAHPGRLSAAFGI
jgi:5,5'-dehydrodivanillate O-demethylase oxygenase subunit